MKLKMMNLILVHLQGFFCTNLKMKLLEHQLSIILPSVFVLFMKQVSKMFDKFPFEDKVIKELACLDPCNRTKISTSGIINLATRFTSFSTDEMDTITIEFQDFRAFSDNQLPTFSPSKENSKATDYFWAAMSEVKCVSDHESHRFGVLSQLAKRVWFFHIPMLIQKGFSARLENCN